MTTACSRPLRVIDADAGAQRGLPVREYDLTRRTLAAVEASTVEGRARPLPVHMQQHAPADG